MLNNDLLQSPAGTANIRHCTYVSRKARLLQNDVRRRL